MHFFFAIEFCLLLFVWWKVFISDYWQHNTICSVLLFPIPFLFGLLQITMITHFFSIEMLRTYSRYIYFYSIINSLLLIPQWYRLMWLFLTRLPSRYLSDWQKLLMAVVLAAMMIVAVIFFFTLYYLWIDNLSGYSQGLRSVLFNYQPVLLDFPTAFYFSFVTYFTLGYGERKPLKWETEWLVKKIVRGRRN